MKWVDPWGDEVLEESLSDLKAISAEAQKQVSTSNPSAPPMLEQCRAGTVAKNNKGSSDEPKE